MTACSSESQFINLKIKDTEIKVEIAQSLEEKMRGLSGRENLSFTEGMLFLYSEPGEYCFWMREMNFPLDIIYIQGEEIKEIFKNVPVLTAGEITEICPQEKADKILELRAGFSDLHNLKIKDKIKFIDY